jgi:quinol monooxygenase YgiN
MIFVIATVTCRPGHRDSFLNEFRQLVPDVLKEEGCIEYGPTIDAETDLNKQNTNDNRVTIVEKWETLDHLKAHLSAPHMEAYRPKVKEFVESSELQVLESAL